MEPVRPPRKPNANAEETARLITDVFAAGIALKDYFTKESLCDIFRTMNNKSLYECVANLGFPSIDALLLDSEKFTTAMIRNKVHYKALEPADQSTKEMYSLVSRQVSKKKKVKPPKVDTFCTKYIGPNKPRSQSFHGRPSAFGAGFIKSKTDPQPMISPNLSKISKVMLSRLTFNNAVQPAQSADTGNRAGVWIPTPDNATKRKSHPRAYKSNSNAGTAKAASTSGSSIYTPAAGVQRFISVLNKHNGVATSEQLKKTYKELYGVDWDAAELKRYFGLSSSREIIRNFLSDLVEITSLRGTSMRCYRLLHPPAAKPARRPPSMEELHKHLLEMLIDREPELIELKSLSTLYKERYAMELNPETQFGISWKDLILDNFSSSFDVDARGRLQLNYDNPEIKKKITEKQVQLALDADIDNDSFSSSSNSTSSSALKAQTKLSTSHQITKRERDFDCAVYVDANRRHRREIDQEPLERAFMRNTRLTQSCRGRVRVTAYRDEDDRSDIIVPDPAQFKNLPVVHFPMPGPSQPQTSPSRLQQAPSKRPVNSSRDHLGSLPAERPTSSLSTRSSTSSIRARCEKTFASVGTFFKRIVEVDETAINDTRNADAARDGYIRHSARSMPEKDVSCAHPYFNVHVVSEAGDARTQAVKRGLTIRH